MAEKQPIFILPENIQRMIGRDAQRNNIMAARLVADTVKTTLGPKGMDKMLVDSMGDIVVTNDGVTILEEMEIEHPAAKMLVEVARTQENVVGDGTTTVAVLAGKLLENAERLLDQKIHATVIAKGYRIASEKALEALQKLAIKISPDDEEVLKSIVMTAMTGKGAEVAKEIFAGIIVKAVKQVQEKGKVDLDNIKLEKMKGGGIENTELMDGLAINKEKVHADMPSIVHNAKIALIDVALEIKNPETDTKINVTSPEQLQSFVDREEKMLHEMVEKIKKSRANVIFCQKGIDDIAQYYLTKANIYAVRRVSRDDIEKLAKATSAKIISNIGELSENDLGSADKVEEMKEGGEGMTYVRGCKNPKALTILIKGGTEHVVAEIERAFKDGLGDVATALREGKIVGGGGAIEVEIARLLRKSAYHGREQLAIEQFADALESIPKILAENAGIDPIDVITDLKASHDKGRANDGINLLNGKIEDMIKSGIIEPAKIKEQAIKSAAEVAIMILRIDDVIASSRATPSSGMGGMPRGGMGEEY